MTTCIVDNMPTNFGCEGIQVGDRIEFFRRTWVPWWWPFEWPAKHVKEETAGEWIVDGVSEGEDVTGITVRGR